MKFLNILAASYRYCFTHASHVRCISCIAIPAQYEGPIIMYASNTCNTGTVGDDRAVMMKHFCFVVVRTWKRLF